MYRKKLKKFKVNLVNDKKKKLAKIILIYNKKILLTNAKKII